MRKYFVAFVLAVAAVIVGGAPAQAQVIYVEAVNGDLSNNRFAPTGPLTLLPGNNILIGDTVPVGGTIDRDYVTFVVPTGFQLDAVVLFNYVSGVGNLSFIGAQAGTQVDVDPTSPAPDPSPLLGYTLFGDRDPDNPGVEDEGVDLLARMADPNEAVGAGGFPPGTPPLPAGTYTFWIQETAVPVTTYSFNFQVSAAPTFVIPEPTSLTLAGLGALLGLGYAGRRLQGAPRARACPDSPAAPPGATELSCPDSPTEVHVR